MSKYTFTFKKDDIFVEFMTEDRDIVERQFQLWVLAADEYAKNGGAKQNKPKTINSLISEPPKQVEKPATAPTPQETPKVQQQEQHTLETQEPVFDQASTLLKTINSIQNEQESAPSEEPAAANVNFDEVLDKSLENPTFEPPTNQDKIFLNLVNSKHTTDKFHYLMITAYYLSEFEKMERFSLKQINSKLMQNLSEIIDHAMLQEAINQGFIELIPDLTGVASVGEYRLTRLGEEFFSTKI